MIKKRKIIVIIVICLYCFINCSKNTEDMIYNYINSSCSFENDDICVIDLREALDIDFDTFYLFGEGSRQDFISKTINISYNNSNFIPDSKYRLVLIKADSIVFDNDFYQNKIRFYIKNKYNETSQLYYKLHNPFFCVSKKNDSKDFYLLMPINEN